nr:uncharacterized protein LOC111514632 [Leptinotarsa decemlineata]XP_023026657.1 uncharacterized protein LOC111514632 [Leptinotarsa decemlineata]XP_023026658.1 uncharacterized protein LOC111514632 [Leptinotarsa decemlineata]
MNDNCSGVSDYSEAGVSIDNEEDERYRPHLISPSTYMILVEQILTLMPSQRHVILIMNEYPMNEINPEHPNTPESPTDVIIFCIRFIAENIFQPIGGLLVYKHLDQSAILAECVKAYITDLWKLGLFVVATVSPAFKVFKAIMSCIADIEDLDTHSSIISYSVHPLKEIIHIYDIQFLLIKLQTLFKEGDVRFEDENVNGKEIFQASWKDMTKVFSMYPEYKMLAEFLANDEPVSRRVHIFTQQIYDHFLDAERQDVLSSNAKGSAVLLNCVRSFLKFTEQDCVKLNQVQRLEEWSCLIDILRDMTFQKSRFRTCTKDKTTAIPHPLNSSVRKKIDFTSCENEIEVKKNDEDIPNIPSTSSGKSKSKKKKKKRENKTEPKSTVPEEKKDKIQALKQIQELCEMLQGTKSVEIVDCSDENETTYEVSKELEADQNDINETEIDVAINEPGNDKNCDIDKNNNSDESIHENQNKSIPGIESNKGIRVRKDLKEENSLDSKNHQNFFRKSNENSMKLSDNENLSDINFVSEFVDSEEPFPDKTFVKKSPENKFYLKSDDETEMSIDKNCDNINNVLGLTNNVENKEKPPDSQGVDFEVNPVTNEMLSTIFGTKKLLRILQNKRVKAVKPDAFIVEPIDSLVKMIQKKNKLIPPNYYGHTYEFFNTTLAFSTLGNNSGLLLVSKD